jgi:hypothetical protein
VSGAQVSAVLATATATPAITTTVSRAAAARSHPSLVAVHNAPRTVTGGRSKPCDLRSNLKILAKGCEIISSVSAPGARVLYTLTYRPRHGHVARETFRGTADARGHSLHVFNIPFVPPPGARHGSPETLVQVTVAATLPSGRVLAPATTHFVLARGGG